MKFINRLLVFVSICLPLTVVSQFRFQESIKSDNVFLERFLTNKSALKQQIATNFYFLGQTKENKLIIYLASKTESAFIQGKRGAYFILVPKELRVNEDEIRMLFLDSDRKVIDAAYIPNLEDIVYRQVKKLPGAKLIADQVEFYAEKLGIGALDNTDTRMGDLQQDNFNGIGLKWDSQFNNGQWIDAHYIKVEIPFYNSKTDIEKLLRQNGFGLFYYFQPSGMNNPIGVYAEYVGTDQPTEETNKEEVSYLIKIKGGGGVNTLTTLRFDLGMTPNYISGRGGTDATDGVRVGISTQNQDFINIRGDNWTKISQFNGRYLYVTLNSKWGTEKDSWAEIKVFLPRQYDISYESLDNNTDDLEYVRIKFLN